MKIPDINKIRQRSRKSTQKLTVSWFLAISVTCIVLMIKSKAHFANSHRDRSYR